MKNEIAPHGALKSKSDDFGEIFRPRRRVKYNPSTNPPKADFTRPKDGFI